mmetsp:Transcript_1403/g.1787  ORF Transcript_1403/g.1787 Transcript_1403/m.1787 type:complete len:197 (-) Transcript_1403:363-953(-)
MSHDTDLHKRVALLNEAFSTSFFRNQLTVWNQEKQSNRRVLEDYWSSGSEEFTEFWEHGDNNSHVKEAVVLTVLEDITESLAGAFIDTVCPELSQLRNAAITSIQSDLASPIPETVLNIVKYVTNSSENNSDKFNRQEVADIIAETKLEKGDFIIHSLLLVRSCLLLQFCISLWLIYSNELASSAASPETSMGDSS